MELTNPLPEFIDVNLSFLPVLYKDVRLRMLCCSSGVTITVLDAFCSFHTAPSVYERCTSVFCGHSQYLLGNTLLETRAAPFFGCTIRIDDNVGCCSDHGSPKPSSSRLCELWLPDRSLPTICTDRVVVCDIFRLLLWSNTRSMCYIMDRCVIPPTLLVSRRLCICRDLYNTNKHHSV